MSDNGNPFDRPLDSELQEHQQAQTATVQSSSNGNPFNELLMSEKAEIEGQTTNDVGNTVIVPKQGESFDDTMKRAVAYGKTVTPSQVNAELKTAPAKTAETLAAAATAGVVGPAALGGLGELIVNSPEIAKATIKHLMEPGTIFKFPAGRAIEYYLAGKLGLSKARLSEVAKMVP